MDRKTDQDKFAWYDDRRSDRICHRDKEIVKSVTFGPLLDLGNGG